MGLGPPVCLSCRVFAKLKNTPVLKNSWECPQCKDQTTLGHLWEQPKEEWKEYQDNTKFIDFLKGK